MNPRDCSLRVVVSACLPLTRLTLLQECLASLVLARQEANTFWRTIGITVVDDYSPSPLVDSLDTSIFDGVDFVRNEGFAGQGGALNFGLAILPADVYAFTDSDCIVSDNWLICLAKAYQQWPAANGVAGPNWLYTPSVSHWTRWLTKQEQRLVKSAFMRYVNQEGWTGRIDCRNLSLRDTFAANTNSDRKFFMYSAGPSVSGLTSHALRKRGDISNLGIRFDPQLAVWHYPVTSLWREMKRYFHWGCHGDYGRYYRDEQNRLLAAFVQRHFKRHFIYPLLIGGVSPLYVLAVHSAYWLGIVAKEIRYRRR